MENVVAVVGVGASAGGLEACTGLMEAWPARTGLACILVQHLDPTHASMMVELLAGHTRLTVLQAAEGMPLQPEHLYVIPPGTYLSVHGGSLHLSPPQARRGARLPFDFLLHSLAEAYGARAACVILSGTGADGTAGLRAIHARGGLVIAQSPDEAEYAGMPKSAIRTGYVNLVLPVADIPAALIAHHAHAADASLVPAGDDEADGWLSRIIDLLRTETAHDFRQYKPGTLQRRVERRMGLAALRPSEMHRYLDLLRDDREERDRLAQDLLINVTSFFRDPKAFDRLAADIIPEMVAAHSLERPLRIWVAGCSTGEETYSLAMLFMERIESAGRPIKLQVFASDVDAAAIAAARDGFYPDSIAGSVSPERLARFFAREDLGWRVDPELRATVVFTVQDLLADPPFSRLDMVSCRNLLIYLQPDAQEKVLSELHFALREGGVLLLGSAETAGADGRFEVVAKAERIYRRLGRGRALQGEHLPTGDTGPAGERTRVRAPRPAARPASRPAALAELGRRLVLEAYAPAAILINAAGEILFSLGPTDRYLRVPSGHATHDILAMARPGLRARLRGAIQAAQETRTKQTLACRVTGDGEARSFSLEVHPILEAGEEMQLVCFVDPPKGEAAPQTDRNGPNPRVAELERELAATRDELQATVRDLEQSSKEHKAINEEALSVNEEYQSTNEELLASKEELQSMNEELTALNSQLQETLERHRTTADDLQNILYSTNVATLFLDRELRIRFFTPDTRSLFAVIAGDVGRPLSDLAALVPDSALEADARAVLAGREPLEREIETKDGAWFRRRVLPYRAHGDRVEGVVITFSDVTSRIVASQALEAAKRQADAANAAKSRFLAAASHDLRQPLQTLALLQGLLSRAVEGERARSLVARVDDTLGAMTGMLNTLLDINEIEAGVVRAEAVPFDIATLLERLRDEFAYHARARGLRMRVVPCHRTVLSDPRLLEQMIRNLLSNALKYTTAGKLLLGCRRHGGTLSVEVWDTGVGIAETEFEAIFEEYHQVGNVARERSRGLGLGLSIVKRLAEMLGHPVRVRSRPGHGSGFAVEVPLQKLPNGALAVHGRSDATAKAAPLAVTGPSAGRRRGVVLVVEDDPDLRDLLGQLLQGEGHMATLAPDGPGALALVAAAAPAPDLLLADYNLPNGLNGLGVAGEVRRALGWDVPAIILTGDISDRTLREVTLQNCVQLNKPVKRAQLLQVVDRLLGVPRSAGLETAASAGWTEVFVVDDDEQVRAALISILEEDGRSVAGFATGEAFLAAYRTDGKACLLVDARLPGMSGIELLQRMRALGHVLPAIMITGQSDVPMAVQAMKAGAFEFIEKPVGRAELLASVGRALDLASDSTKAAAWRQAAAQHLAGLTARERQIMSLVLAGQPSKNIAADLGISQRTVENHRASVMRKTGAASLPALARLALAAADGKETEGKNRGQANADSDPGPPSTGA